jgi:hypothetical protein
MNSIIEVTQKPIIAYSLLQEMSDKVALKIESLNIDTLEPTDENLSLIKSTRAELNNDFKILEEQRKMVKDIVLKDYNIFEYEYKKLISIKFKDADSSLKTLADTVDGRILTVKVDGIVDYFNKVNTFDFVRFEDLNLKIIKSKSDKSIKAEIDEYVASVKMSIDTIASMQNHERIFAKFQIYKDLNRAISETNIELQREEQIKKQRDEQLLRDEENQKRYDEQQKQRDIDSQQQDESIEAEVIESAKQFMPEIETPKIDTKIYKASFNVFGTKAQISELKQYLQNKGVRYE